MATIKTATRVAQARLHRARKEAGVTDLQATTLSELIDEVIGGLERAVEADGTATLSNSEIATIVFKTKGMENDAEPSFHDHMLVSAIATAVATEFRAAGYAVRGDAIAWPKVTVSLF